MKQLMSLLKATMSQDMDLVNMKTNSKSKMNKIFLPILIILIIMFSIGMYAYMIASQLAPMHLTYILLTIFIIVVSLFTLIDGIYKSQGILFEARDNNLLFSLPIAKSKILFMRIFKLMVFQFLYNCIFMIPVYFVYIKYENPNISFYILSVLMLFLLPIIPTIVSSIIGYIIKGISSKFKARNIIEVISTIILLLIIIFASFNMQSFCNNLIKNASSINDVIMKVYYPVGLYINLIQNFNILDLFILLAINIIPAIIFIYIASIYYFRIISKTSENAKNSKISKQVKLINKNFIKKTQMSALINKELKRYFSSPVVIINTGFGIVLIIVITIIMSINFNAIINSIVQGSGVNIPINEVYKFLPKIFYAFVVFTSCTACITASMISLEGKSFNITKSLPIATEKILLSKVLASNIISIPAIVISDFIFFMSFKISIIYAILILLASIIMPTFIALMGLLINLKYPKMNATSDMEIVKQSMSTVIAVFIGMAIGILAFIGIGVENELYIALELLIILAISLILWRALKKYGVKKFNNINV